MPTSVRLPFEIYSMILSSWALDFTNLGFGPCLIHANDKREWGLMCSPTFAFSIVYLQFMHKSCGCTPICLAVSSTD